MAIPRPLAFSLAISLASAQPVPAVAAKIVVSTTADDVMVNGNCTLREAVIAANSDASVDRCPAGSGTDTVVLGAGTYRLSLLGNSEDSSRTGDLDVHTNLTIRGAGAAVTNIEAGFSDDRLLRDRVIHVSAAGSLTVSRVTIRGGYCAAGAGIYSDGDLHIRDSRVDGNVTSQETDCAPLDVGWGGAGIVNTIAGWLTMAGSTVSGNWVLGVDDLVSNSESPGGGLRNFGVAQIVATLFTGNFAAMGGALLNAGDLEIATSQIGANYSRFGAAALWNLEDASIVTSTIDGNVGGSVILNGVGSTPALLRILNSTISGNLSYYSVGSIHNQAGNVHVTASTIAGNTAGTGAAGIGGSGRTELADSIVFNPPNEWGPNGGCQFPIISGGNNLDGDGSCGLSEEQGDLPNTDPLLGPLANNGGPTPTHALLSGSPAIDHIPADQCAVTTDQRSVARPQLPRPAACDIGAYERSPAGDIGLIAKDVVQLWNLIQARRLTLLQSLKQAVLAVHDGDPAGACSALETFSTLVAAYANDGSLTASQAASLLGGAERARAIICRQDQVAAPQLRAPQSQPSS